MTRPGSHNPLRRPRWSGFTLVELLITVSIIGIMAGMVLFAYFGATEAAKEQKTKAMIAKLDAIIKEKWDSYRTRRVPITIPAGTPPNAASLLRLNALRELMRLELPDRWSDITDDPITIQDPVTSQIMARPAVSQAYRRKYMGGTPTAEHQNAECLYLIVMAAVAEEGDSRDVFRADDIGDVDGDKFFEFLDGWRNPIRFLRWPAGFQDSELQIAVKGNSGGSNVTGFGLSGTSGSYVGGAAYLLASDGRIDTSQASKITGYQLNTPAMNGSPAQATVTCATSLPSPKVAIMYPDPFDPRGVHPTATLGPSFAVYPMIFSAGGDKVYGIVCDHMGGLSYASNGNSPFVKDAGGDFIGTEKQVGSEPDRAWVDNIHNHLMNLK